MPYLTLTMPLSYWHKTIFYFPGENCVKVYNNNGAPNEAKQNYFFGDKKHSDFEDPSCDC